MADNQLIRAVITAADQCETPGYKVRAAAPVLALCRELVEAGHDPACQLHVYRSGVLALRVRSIGDAARLTIRGDGVGFRCVTEMVGPSPVRFSERADPSLTLERVPA
jgi:hypothetical protein